MEYYSRICKLLDVPAPKKSAFEIWPGLMLLRNERKLYRRTCDQSGEEIISAYPTKTPFPVYKNEIWWGDSWEPCAHGRNVNFSAEFFPQLKDLQNVVPREGTSVFSSENSKYNSHTRESKNCYMNALVYRGEDTLYSYWIVNAKNVVDSFMCNNSTLSYECLDCDEAYDCVALQECYNCNNCYFSCQLRRCQNCIGCWDLVGKNYYICNEAVSKEAFELFKANLLNGSYASFSEGWEIFKQAYSSAKHRATFNLNSENAIGDHLINCKNSFFSFDAIECEDFYYSISGDHSKDILHCYSAGWPACELVYQSAVTRGSQNIAYCYYTFFSNNLRYCDSSMNVKNSFGCIGLRKKENCILNKAYSRHEHDKLKKRLISHMRETGEWGEQLPPLLSTFSYNQTAAQDYFPLSKSEALEKGFSWYDNEEDLQTVQGANSSLPDKLEEIADGVLHKTLYCEKSGKAFRVVKQELDFYRKMNLPLPRFSPEQRHNSRLARRNPYQLFKTKCAKTGKEIYTSFPEGKVKQVYSEEAYRDELL